MSDCEHLVEIRGIERQLAYMDPVEADRAWPSIQRELDLIEATCYRECAE